MKKIGLRMFVVVAVAALAMVAAIGCATNLTDLELSGTLSTDTIAEITSGSGVTVDGLTIKDTGFADDFTLTGTTPKMTIGDAGEEDASLVFDGNAQDYYVALDDSADDLLVGLGSTVGTTPAVQIDENLDLTLCDATETDCDVTFDGNAQDFYIGLDDTADDLLIGLGSTVGTTGIIHLDENQDMGLGGASAGAKLDVTGNVLLDGAADEIQLTAQGYTTQTSSILVAEQSDGTDVFTVANSGNTDIAGTLNYGSSDLYPLGYASSGQQAVYGTASVTGTLSVSHGLTTVTFCLATLGEDPTSGGGDAAMVTASVAANACTVKVWQDDFVTAATETGVSVHWLVIGAP